MKLHLFKKPAASRRDSAAQGQPTPGQTEAGGAPAARRVTTIIPRVLYASRKQRPAGMPAPAAALTAPAGSLPPRSAALPRNAVPARTATTDDHQQGMPGQVVARTAPVESPPPRSAALARNAVPARPAATDDHQYATGWANGVLAEMGLGASEDSIQHAVTGSADAPMNPARDSDSIAVGEAHQTLTRVDSAVGEDNARALKVGAGKTGASQPVAGSSKVPASSPLALIDWAQLSEGVQGELTDQQNKQAADHIVKVLRERYPGQNDFNLLSVCTGQGKSDAYFIARLAEEGCNVKNLVAIDILYGGDNGLQPKVFDRLKDHGLLEQGHTFASANECLQRHQAGGDLDFPLHAIVAVHPQIASFFSPTPEHWGAEIEAQKTDLRGLIGLFGERDAQGRSVPYLDFFRGSTDNTVKITEKAAEAHRDDTFQKRLDGFTTERQLRRNMGLPVDG